MHYKVSDTKSIVLLNIEAIYVPPSNYPILWVKMKSGELHKIECKTTSELFSKKRAIERRLETLEKNLSIILEEILEESFKNATE